MQGNFMVKSAGRRTQYFGLSKSLVDKNHMLKVATYFRTRMTSDQPLPHSLHTAIDFVAGSLGAVASVYVGQPLDTVKVKMQTFPELYKNSVQCAVSTFKNDGIAHGLYAGTAPALIANVAENSVLFAAYGLCQKSMFHLLDKKSTASYKSLENSEGKEMSIAHHLSALENATAGAIAAIFSTFVLCPTELIKCRVQALRETSLPPKTTKNKNPNSLIKANNTSSKPTSQLHNIGPWHVTKQIYATEGIVGFFRGLLPTFAREVPGYFCFFGGYEFSRTLLTPQGKSKDDIGPLGVIVSGGIGGTALWLAIFPFDVVKSRMQIFTGNASFATIFLDVVKQQGIRGLYNGLGPTLLRTFPASGALFLTYEYVKSHLSGFAQGFL